MHEFQSSPCDRLPPTTARLAVLQGEAETKNTESLQFWKKGSAASGKQKQEEKPSAKKAQVASSGPPRTKEVTPQHAHNLTNLLHPEPGPCWQGAGDHPTSQKNGHHPEEEEKQCSLVSPDVAPKRRSMRILHARFTRARTSDSETSGAGLDGDDATEIEASVPEQESVDDIDDISEDFGEGDHYDHAEDAFVHSSSYPEEQGGSDVFTDSSVRRTNIESIVDVTDDQNLTAAVAILYRVPKSQAILLLPPNYARWACCSWYGNCACGAFFFQHI
ncbi:hypothetical protein Pyn_08790 [Prunus yedoensis var. nudiflora]|uniref:Uncharacterized protein n=1 Tax=Prunus yedoensis var. nudiflora TaxID=2094558 RepID=A0A314Z716_PRUYE|nr:hypothetical protein Pyn_08790 [Prunus yedoensis var. nudiflora]